MKHTQGKWFVKKCDWCDNGRACAITSNNQKKYYDADIISDASREECHHIMSEANAKLIASAPELLEACKMAKGEVRRLLGLNLGHKTLQVIEQAIAKAEEI